MKKSLLAMVCFAGLTTLFAQTDCSGGRYYTPIFTSLDSSMNVTYGNSMGYDGQPQSLEFDMWYPSGDLVQERPVVILAHGGSFYAGDKTDPGVQAHCRWLASMGYVAISMEYRLIPVFDVIFSADVESTYVNVVYRAVHDQMALIRFLRQSHAVGGNPYQINPNLVIVGGFSAGSILSLHTTYMDDPSKLHPDIDQASDGGFYGASGNPGYSTVPQAVLNYCGALGDTLYMEAGDQPLVSVHNTGDGTVPCSSAVANPGIPVMLVHGSASIHSRALNVGVTNPFLAYSGSGHCDFWSTPGQSDSTFGFVADFLEDQLCIQGLYTEQNPQSVFFTAYPNPATSHVMVDIPGNNADWQLTMSNMIGQQVKNTLIPSGQNIYQLSVEGLKPGMYMITLSSGTRHASQKILVK